MGRRTSQFVFGYWGRGEAIVCEEEPSAHAGQTQQHLSLRVLVCRIRSSVFDAGRSRRQCFLHHSTMLYVNARKYLLATLPT